MASASSSSGSVPNAPRKYDVFISFRGESRDNFTSHLHAALKRSSLEVFRDDKKLEKGDEIAPSLIQAIKDSSVSVIVFSEDYASSKWYLDELHQIMQYRKDEGQYAIPIFYKVDPKDVRNQTGAYEKAFEKHEIYYPDRVNRWRAALSEAGKLRGKHCQTSTDESNLIEEIVADVGTQLERLHNCQGTLKDAIGIDEMIEPIEELLEKFNKVGIWGMGGLGKTTMAKALFAKLSYRFDNCCFLENIREKIKRVGPESVCNSLVSELLGQDTHNNSSNALGRNGFVARRLGSVKAFVVLDDVGSCDQLHYLQHEICNFFGEGSKVIITTRDKHLLQQYRYEIYEAQGLSYDNSYRLFIHEAFGSNHPEDGYEHLIKGFVDYTQQNPLAIKVLGSEVRSVHKKEWDILLRKLRAGNPNHEIQKVLRLRFYSELDYEEKKIFLEIACFLKGESKEFVIELLDSYGFHGAIGIRVLIDKALIVMTNGKVEMHALLHEMGLQIVREESINKPGKKSRLWDPCEIYDVLKNCEGEKEIEGIIFDISGMRPLELTAKTFNKMKRIRFLKFYSSDGMSIPTGLESISTKIRYFYWKGYPGKSLPSNFCAERLLELNLKESMVETLWEGVQDIVNLRRLILRKCHNLRELPDFSKAFCLESVDLSHCERLSNVHASLLSLHSLISLDVRYCSDLRSLKSRIHLKFLRELKILDCKNLKEFSVSSEELTSLNLSKTLIEEWSPSIGRCSKLRRLRLVDTKLNNVPIQALLSCLTFLEELSVSNLQNIDNVNVRMLFDHLRSLQSLSLIQCCNLTELPDNITQLSSLDRLDLERCSGLTKLPFSMRHLSKLHSLSVEGCTALRSLPELPPSLRILIATDCTSLETVSAIEEQAKFWLQKGVHEKETVAVSYPGKKVPEWFGNNQTQNDSDTVNLSLSSHILEGFLFCAVVPDLPEEAFLNPVIIPDLPKEASFIPMIVFSLGWDKIYGWLPFIKVSPGNVILGSDPLVAEEILDKIKQNKKNHEAATYNPNLSFKFGFGKPFHFGPTFPAKEGGVYPILYASEYSELNPNSRKRKAIMI